MDWITENIEIGNFLDVEQASSEELNAILCVKTDCCSEDNTEFDIMCMPLIDGVGNDKRYLNDALDFIHDVVSNGEKILVHCHAGRSRSVCVTARYFMVKQGITSHQALEKIRAKREIYLSPGIEEILEL